VTPASRSGAPPSADRLPALDGLRGLAIALVTMFHFLRGPGGTPVDLSSAVADAGWIGVDLFFVISGFLITGILLDARGGRRYFRNFYARRILRILQLYYGYRTLLLLLSGSAAGVPLGASYFADHQAWFWTHTTNWLLLRTPGPGGAGAAGFGALWSLALEEQFYLVWPTVVALVSIQALRRICLVVIAGSLVLRLGLALLGTSAYTLYASSFTHLDPLAVGALLSIMARQGGLSGAGGRARWWLMMGASVFVICAVLVGTGAPVFPLPASLMISAVAAAWGGLVALVVIRPGAGSFGWIRAGPLRTLGKYSYAFYLLQLPVAAALGAAGLRELLPNRFAHAGAVAAATFVAAVLSWHLWEKRWLALKDRFPRIAAAAMPAP
jgi:peptidoglycan/LPS O-acetylase OafA/YrhL